ncbi:hypothetical protein D3C73_878120 [compost metagenome]
MLAVHRLHALGKPDEADGQASMLQQLANRVIRSQLLAAFPYAFAHHEIGGFCFLDGLNFEAMQQSVHSDVQVMLQFLIKSAFICFLAFVKYDTMLKTKLNEIDRIKG